MSATTLTITVRSDAEHASAEAVRLADEAHGLYVVRVISCRPVGPWTEDEAGTALYEVEVAGDPVPEAERRLLDGNR